MTVSSSDFAPMYEPSKRELAAEEKTQIDLGVVTGRCAASHQAAGEGEARHAFVPCRGANVFEHHVYAALVRDAADFFADFLRLVIDDVIGAKLAGFRQFLIGASCGNHARAEKFGDLYAGAADAAACSEYQHVFPRLKFGARDEHVPRRLKNERDAGRFFKREIFGIGHAIYFRATDKFGASAVDHVAQSL